MVLRRLGVLFKVREVILEILVVQISNVSGAKRNSGSKNPGSGVSAT